MCILSNFEKSNQVEASIYPEAATEFRAIANMLGAFSPVGVTALGEMEALLHLRRIAIGASLIFSRDFIFAKAAHLLP